MELLLFACRIFLAGIFLIAGLAKLRARDHFTQAVQNYGLLPVRVVQPVAAALPVAEAASAVALALGIATRAVAAVIAGLLILFGAATTIALARGKKLECGCFGSAAPRQLTWQHVLNNFAMSALAITVAIQGASVWSLDAALGVAEPARATSGDAAAVALATILAVLTTILAREFVALRSTVVRLEGSSMR